MYVQDCHFAQILQSLSSYILYHLLLYQIPPIHSYIYIIRLENAKNALTWSKLRPRAVHIVFVNASCGVGTYKYLSDSEILAVMIHSIMADCVPQSVREKLIICLLISCPVAGSLQRWNKLRM